MSTRLRLSTLNTLLLTCAVLLCSSAGAAQTTASPASVPTLQLAQPHSGPAYAERLKLAQEPLSRARAEVASGTGMMAVGGVVSLISIVGVAVTGGEPWAWCGVGVGVLGFGVGSGIASRGAQRIRAIKLARRELGFTGAEFALGARGAGVGARFSF